MQVQYIFQEAGSPRASSNLINLAQAYTLLKWPSIHFHFAVRHIPQPRDFWVRGDFSSPPAHDHQLLDELADLEKFALSLPDLSDDTFDLTKAMDRFSELVRVDKENSPDYIELGTVFLYRHTLPLLPPSELEIEAESIEEWISEVGGDLEEKNLPATPPYLIFNLTVEQGWDAGLDLSELVENLAETFDIPKDKLLDRRVRHLLETYNAIVGTEATEISILVISTVNAAAPTFLDLTVTATEDEYAEGRHLELAREKALDAGLPEPLTFIVWDPDHAERTDWLFDAYDDWAVAGGAEEEEEEEE